MWFFLKQRIKIEKIDILIFAGSGMEPGENLNNYQDKTGTGLQLHALPMHPLLILDVI